MASALQIVNHFAHELRRVRYIEKAGKAVDLERVRTETLNSDSDPLQNRQVVLDPIGVTRRYVECLRQEQLLRGNSLLFHSMSQFFEQDTLVRSVLIHENKAVRIFHQDIQLTEYADDLELLLSRFCDALLWGWGGPIAR